ncbi:MAG: IPT/TIG domain-containing protein [Treponema sp.]|jgi:transglutaminase-like putative cysteine protease|nr:IPT/TIG domain-containing protein [Treponema sp.]
MLTAVVILSTFFVGKKLRAVPDIAGINPSVGSPGDVMVLTGKDFGDTQGSGFVEIGGSRITSSGYISWSDTEIKIILPANVQDGLVFVSTDSGKSAPAFFANKATIPVEVPPNPQTTLPVITSLSEENVTPGMLISITGNNFGSIKGDSCVYFTAAWDNNNASDISKTAQTYPPSAAGFNSNFITANSTDFDYEYWSNNEIRVRIPDGAASGPIYVHTEKGDSGVQKLTVTIPCGTKQLSNRLTYIVELNEDVSNAKATDDSVITLRVPRPHESASQPFVKLTECKPEPTIENYRNTIIHQIQASELGETKVRFKQSFVISVYDVTTTVRASRVKPYTEKNSMLYTEYTKSDACVPSDNEAVRNLCTAIIRNEHNPYTQAKVIYDYLLVNYKLLQNVRTGNVAVTDMLRTKTGDAYDFTMLYTALLRAAGIPAMPVSGVLVQSTLTTKNHWWCRFYLENFGWIPADPALGAGLENKPFHKKEDPGTFYFGNLDSQHIAFSLGWNDIKPALQNSKTLYRPRTYALQAIWEETSAGTESYSSLWDNPIILGVY